MNQPKNIYWIPDKKTKYPPVKRSGTTWEIYTQASLKLEPNEKKAIGLNFGYWQTDGLIIVFPTEDI